MGVFSMDETDCRYFDHFSGSYGLWIYQTGKQKSIGFTEREDITHQVRTVDRCDLISQPSVIEDNFGFEDRQNIPHSNRL